MVNKNEKTATTENVPKKGHLLVQGDAEPIIGARVYGHWMSGGEVDECEWDIFTGEHLFFCEAIAPVNDEKLGWNAIVKKIIAKDEQIPIPVFKCSINLASYKGQLPEGLKILTLINGLTTYPHPLPSTLHTLRGVVTLEGYQFALPTRLRTLGWVDDLDGGPYDLGGYEQPLPDGLRTIWGAVDIDWYRFPLPKNLRITGHITGPNYDLPMPPLIAAKETDEQIDRLLPELTDILGKLKADITPQLEDMVRTKKQKLFCDSLSKDLREMLTQVNAVGKLARKKIVKE